MRSRRNSLKSENLESKLTQAVWVAQHATSPVLRKTYLEKAEALVKVLEGKQRKPKGRIKERKS